MTTRISRDEYGLKLAEAAALRADCSRRQVGAVIVSEDGSIVSTGMNGLASGLPGCMTEGACPRGQMSYDHQPADVNYEGSGCRSIHAEVNAVIRAGRDRCIGATIYVSQEPCFHCSVVIEGAGLARVVTPETDLREPGIYAPATADSLPEVSTVLLAANAGAAVVEDLDDDDHNLATWKPEPEPDLAQLQRLAEAAQAAERRFQLAANHEGWRR